MPNEQCEDSFFDNCDDNKKHWTFQQLWRKLTAKVDGSDCPALRVTGNITSSIESPAASSILTVVAEGTTRANLKTDIDTKLAAIGVGKYKGMTSPAIDPTDITKTFVIIMYTV